MLCQQCQKREANVHFTQIINGNKVEMYLCSQCADQKGSFSFSPQINLGDFLWGFPGFYGSAGFSQMKQPREQRCDFCGMSFNDFRKTGKLGCANCYRVFRENLNPILRRLHGSAEHTGKVPGRISAGFSGNMKEKTQPKVKNAAPAGMHAAGELERLKAELAEAIEKEEYERAAQLRDRIRELEGTGK